MPGRFDETNLEDSDDQIQINVVTLTHLTRRHLIAFQMSHRENKRREVDRNGVLNTERVSFTKCFFQLLQIRQ